MTVDHNLVELSLSALQINKVASLEHFAIVSNHFFNIAWIEPTVFRAVVIDIAGEFLTVRGRSQPRATSKILAGIGIYPDLATLHVASNIRPIGFPPVDLLR